MKALYWPPVAQRIQFNPIVHTFKSLNNLSPTSSLASFQCASYQLTPSDPPLSLVFVFQATLSNWHLHPLLLVYGAIFLPGLVALPPLPLSENLLKVTSFLISWFVSFLLALVFLLSSFFFFCFSLPPNALYPFLVKRRYINVFKVVGLYMHPG